jgi:hypothetical protein
MRQYHCLTVADLSVRDAGAPLRPPVPWVDERLLAGALEVQARRDRLGRIPGDQPNPPTGHPNRWIDPSLDSSLLTI